MQLLSKVLYFQHDLIYLTGSNNYEVFVHETMEAEVGHNVTIPCLMRGTDPQIVDIRWMKNGKTKLIAYHPVYGPHNFWPNVTCQAKRDDKDQLIGLDLQLPPVNKWDSGSYSCEVQTFRSGVLTNETKLTVKDDIKLLCNVNRVLEVNFGNNATIQCRVNSNAHYRWTKNNKLVSENESLELRQVTEVDGGVYELTVNAGDKTLHEVFHISVLPITTSFRTESTLGSTDTPQPSSMISSTKTLSTDDYWTPQPNSSTAIVSAVAHVTPSKTSTSVSFPSSPGTQSVSVNLLNSSASSNEVTELISTRRTASDEMKNESKIYKRSTEGISSVSTEEFRTTQPILGSTALLGEIPAGNDTLTMTVLDGKETKRNHMLIAFIVILLLLSIVVVVVLYRRQLLKKRMDLPPPFKPPPPPVKYTSSRRSETQHFPTSRCNSIAEPMRPIFI
ncbi:PREDICTED: T-cell surface protein tactile-like isoform X2 [Cyprinodon variegatus]|uniref:T-cell surface protein tactile-like isoform X2 n=1 Tax=Cyprinodon variegatus TaxID=28743 RepID=UPI00074258DE|nr:PREDICTED: T-cell surface protein tactile-like isoform X2 [Cyprinodon variegatus]